VKTILLLAGRSKRFWPLAEKSLFPLCGKTLVEHQVERLKKGGCTDITLVVGAHNKKEMKALFPKLTIVEQKELDMGMQGACMDALKSTKEPVMIVSGNDVIDPAAFASLKKEASKPGVAGAILARKMKRYFPGGYLVMKGQRIDSMIEKPGEGNEPSKLVNIVAHVHNDPKALLDALKKTTSKRDDGYEAALSALFKTHTYRAVPYEGVWQPVKYPWHLLPLLELLLAEIKAPSIHKSAKIHPSAIVDGNVVIEEGARILANASIVGPCHIGARTIVGNNALVRASSVGADCVVGYATEVKGSALAGPVWTHMTYLGDSIVGRNVSFGGGCVSGNLRLDEGEIQSKSPNSEGMLPTGLTKFGLVVGDGCRFGIQVGSNPGVKIGRHSFIAGGVMLNADIPDESFVTPEKRDPVIRKNKAAPASMRDREQYKKKL
jgi:bifunctional UDP-N-acetylglucosamine pyrophosphorylase/glucosamine-1-phosphate N-acetyltransferase